MFIPAGAFVKLNERLPERGVGYGKMATFTFRRHHE
jgi:hypothetical protein